jgi:DNA-binding transcriptional MerR regulator
VSDERRGPGRPKESAPEGYVTIPEAAEKLGITTSAVRGRIERGTLKAEEPIVEGHGVRQYIPERELEKALRLKKQRDDGVTQEDLVELDRTQAIHVRDVLDALGGWAETIRAEVERQHTQLVPLSEEGLENQRRLLGQIEAVLNNQEEIFRFVREATAKMQEAARREEEFQRQNIELNERIAATFERMAAEADKMREEREAMGEREQRSIWRRLFGN